jgi:dihydroorotate dehydrogenase (fumarate)/dihydropyrimidine dehydrogenase (NAD+) subunit PreA
LRNTEGKVADLSVEIAGVKFKNPVWVASAEPTESFDKMKRGIDAGAGAIITKSFNYGPEMSKQTDLAKYCILGEDHQPVYGKNIPKLFTLYCRTGEVQKPEDEWLAEIEKAQRYASKFDSQVIGSVAGQPTVAEAIKLARKMEQIGLKMLEISVGCPQSEEMKEKGALLKCDQDYFDIARAVIESVSIPVLVKLTPQQADLIVTATGIKEAGAAGVTCHNRFLGFAVDIENARPYIWGYAGVGGPWMMPITLRWVAKIHSANPSFAISASSGPYDWRDVVQFLMAGATTVQSCSAIMVKGYSVITRMVEGLNQFMDAKGYQNVRDIIGVATRAAHTYQDMYTLPEYQERASVNMELCIDCGKCLEVCWYDAMENREGIYTVNDALCKGCHNCQIACPVEGCITLNTLG